MPVEFCVHTHTYNLDSSFHSEQLYHATSMIPTSPLLPPLPSSTASGPSSRPFFVPSVNEHTFHAHSPIAIASKVTLQSAGVGLLVSAVQNALEKYVLDPLTLGQWSMGEHGV